MLSGRMNALPSSTDNISAPARTLKSGEFFSRVEFFEKRLEMEMERERETRIYIDEGYHWRRGKQFRCTIKFSREFLKLDLCEGWKSGS